MGDQWKLGLEKTLVKIIYSGQQCVLGELCDRAVIGEFASEVTNIHSREVRLLVQLMQFIPKLDSAGDNIDGGLPALEDETCGLESRPPDLPRWQSVRFRARDRVADAQPGAGEARRERVQLGA